MTKYKVGLTAALEHLKNDPGEFATLFKHGTLDVEIYRPHEVDKQSPHERDEIYVISAGRAVFYFEGRTTEVKTGDFLFVPAFTPHHFEAFSKDFSTWVFFYGPEGGEKSEMINYITE